MGSRNIFSTSRIIFLMSCLLFVSLGAIAQTNKIHIATDAEIKATIASLKPNEYVVLTETIGKKFTAAKVRGLFVSVPQCNKSCMALQAPKISRTIASGTYVGSISPAQIICADTGGKIVTARGYKNSETDFCVFKDGSMAEVWSYVAYNKAQLRK